MRIHIQMHDSLVRLPRCTLPADDHFLCTQHYHNPVETFSDPANSRYISGRLHHRTICIGVLLSAWLFCSTHMSPLHSSSEIFKQE